MHNPSASASRAPAGSTMGGEASPIVSVGVGIPPLSLPYTSPRHDFFGTNFWSRISEARRFFHDGSLFLTDLRVSRFSEAIQC